MAGIEFPQWSERLSVGNAVLDQHHRQLFALTGRAARLVEGGADLAQLRELLNELVRYTAYHFAEEERLMAAAGYPFLDLHRDSHRGIVMRIEDLAATANRRPLGAVLADTALFLSGWLVHHIEIEDFEYRDCVGTTA